MPQNLRAPAMPGRLQRRWRHEPQAPLLAWLAALLLAAVANAGQCGNAVSVLGLVVGAGSAGRVGGGRMDQGDSVSVAQSVYEACAPHPRRSSR
jgi:hypothetical protein